MTLEKLHALYQTQTPYRATAGHHHYRRLLVVALAAGFVFGVVGWHRWHRVPALHVVGKIHIVYGYTCCPMTNGVLFKEPGKTPNEYALVFRDWSGRVISRGNTIVVNPHGTPDEQNAMSPDGHWYLLMLPIGTGKLANVSLWHDGHVVRQDRLAACPFVEMRNNGTGWLVGYRAQALYVYAIRPDRVLAAQDRQPMMLSSHQGGDSKPALTVDIPVSGDDYPAFGGGCSLSPDTSTLRIDAFHRENVEQITEYSSFLTYHLHTTANHLSLQRIGMNINNKSLSPDDGKLDYPMTVAPASDSAIFTTPSGEDWNSPKEYDYPQYRTAMQSKNRRFALVYYVTRGKLHDLLQRLPINLRFGYTGETRKADFIVDLYEQPGILRAHSEYPLGAAMGTNPYVLLSPDGRSQFVILGNTVIVCHQ